MPEPTREVVVEKKPVYECPLCMDEETDLSSLACGHIFGTECVVHFQIKAVSLCEH